jgi:molecular chaperone Hsp33
MIKKDIFNKDVKAQFKASAKERLFRFVMAGKSIKGAIVHCTRMVQEMQANHQLGPMETLVLGQGYIAASLVSATLKDKNDRMSLSVKCSGPIKGFDVETNGYGEVRGYLKTPSIDVKDTDQIKHMSTLFGAGFLIVTTYSENAARPYSGQVALEYGSIAEDLANYYLISEQIPTGFKLSVYFDENEKVKGAGGLFLQALPGADPDQVAAAEAQMAGMDSLGKMFADDDEAESLVQSFFSDLKPEFIGSSRVEFFCRCSKERMSGYLKNLQKDELTDIKKNGPFPLELRCHNCNSVYQFAQPELLAL